VFGECSPLGLVGAVWLGIGFALWLHLVCAMQIFGLACIARDQYMLAERESATTAIAHGRRCSLLSS